MARVCGLEDKTLSDSAFSRFFSLLQEREIAPDLPLQRVVEQFAHLASSLGHTLVVDSTDIESYANPRRKRIRDTGANWGIRTTKSKSATRKEKERFFGRKLHLISCADTGMPLTFIITPANVNDTTMLEQLVDKARATYSWMKPERLLADRGCDNVHNRQSLLNKGILPIIHIMEGALWDAPIIDRSFRSSKHSRLLNRYYYLESAKVERHIGLSILTYGLTMLMRALAGACEKLRHMRIRVPRQRILRCV